MKRLKGFVATLDVLGFSDMLQQDGYSDILNNYLTCVNDVIRPADASVECILFSDSIVLTSKGDDDEAFENIIRVCSSAFYALLKNDIAVRGAIAFGTYWRESRDGSVFLAGRPIVEAYRCEEDSEWVGILLCTSVLRQRQIENDTTLPEIDVDDADGWTLETLAEATNGFSVSFRLQRATVPMRDGATGKVEDFQGYGIVPLEYDDDGATALRKVQSAKNALFGLRLKASRPRAQAKYGASMAFLDDVIPRLRGLSKAYRLAKNAANEAKSRK